MIYGVWFALRQRLCWLLGHGWLECEVECCGGKTYCFYCGEGA